MVAIAARGTLDSLLIVFILSTTIGPLAAQTTRTPFRVIEDSTLVQEVQLRDGSKLLGRVVRIDGTTVNFVTLGGLEVSFQRRDAESVREIYGAQRGEKFWPEDPSNSRLFVAPTARIPRRGHGYFGIYELVVPSFAVGIADVAMIAGGFSIIPGIDLDDQVFYLAPKLQLLDTKYVQGAVGVFWVQPGVDNGSGGLVYGGVTAGDMMASFSGGLAFPFVSDGGFEEDPLLTLGGELRVSRGLKLITEHWIATGEGAALLSLGVRIIGSRLTVEAAAVTSSEAGILFPLVNFSLTW